MKNTATKSTLPVKKASQRKLPTKKKNKMFVTCSLSRLHAYDVVFDQTTSSVTTVGYRRFRVTLDLAIEKICNGKSQGGWNEVIQRVTDLIGNVGGRFLARGEKGFVELSRDEAQLKVGFALRERLLSISPQLKSSFMMGVSGNLIRKSVLRGPKLFQSLDSTLEPSVVAHPAVISSSTAHPAATTPSAAFFVKPIVTPPTTKRRRLSYSMNIPSLMRRCSLDNIHLLPPIVGISDDDLSIGSDPLEFQWPTTPLLLDPNDDKGFCSLLTQV